MKGHLRKYYFVYIAIFLLIVSMLLWLNDYIDGIDSFIKYGGVYKITDGTMNYLFRISFLPLLFLSIYFGVRVKKLSRMVKFDSKEEYEKAIKEKRLKKLEKQQEKLDAQRKKLEEE